MNKLIIAISLLIVIIVPKTAYAYPPDYDAPFIEKRYQAPEITGTLAAVPSLYQIISILFLIAILAAIAFIIYKKKVKNASAATTTQTVPTPAAPTSPSKFKINPKIALPALVLIVAVIAAVAYLQLKTPKQQGGLQATPTPIPTTDERLKVLDLVPIEVKGEYIFEYLPDAQFFYLRITSTEKDVQIRQEIADKIKAVTSDGDYCKFGVVVWSPDKDASAKLPGC